MEPRTAASQQPSPEAVEFIRFCYQRRRVGWPELYDEMCGVAARGLFRGYGSDDLAAFGIGFSLFEMPALAAMSARVIADEQARRRPVSVTIREDVPAVAAADADTPGEATPARTAQVTAGVPLATDVEVVVQVPILPSSIAVPVRPQAVPVMAESDRGVVPVRLTLAPTRA